MNVAALSDDELRDSLIKHGVNAGPVTGTTRAIYEKKLTRLLSGGAPSAKAVEKKTPVKVAKPPKRPVSKSRKTNKSESEEDELEIISPRGAMNRTNSKPIVSTPKKDRERTPSPEPPVMRARRSINASLVSPAVVAPSPIRHQVSAAPSSIRHPLITKGPSRSGGDQPGTTPPRKAIVRTPLRVDRTNSADKFNTSSVTKRKNVFDLGNTSAEESDNDGAETSRVFYNSPQLTIGKSFNTDSVLRSKHRPTRPVSQTVRKSSLWKDISSVLIIVLSIFFVLLGVAYMTTARTQAVMSTVNALSSSVRDTIHFFYAYAIIPVVVIAVAALAVVAVYFGVKKYQEQQEKEEENFQCLVEKIMDIVRESSEDGDEYVSVPHVRDVVFPPSKRTKTELGRWNRAVDFLDTSESRIATETRIIRGQECAVWRWLPYKRSGFQGNAYQSPTSPPVSGNVPETALTRCLKIREVFDEASTTDLGYATIKSDLLDKVYPIIPVHMAFDKDSKDGIVFMRLHTLSDAKKAFTALHSWWYNGHLLRVKYMRDRRYAERFPETEGL